MIRLNVIYRCKDGKRNEFFERLSALGVPEKTRAEDGNISYDYFWSTADENTLLLVERWRDAEALASHAKQPYCIELQQVKAELTENVTLEKYVLN